MKIVASSFPKLIACLVAGIVCGFPPGRQPLASAQPPPGSRAASITIDGPPPPAAPEVIARDAQGRATLRATRLEEPIQLDGVLREEVYQQVRSASGFIQQEPQEGQPATEKTEIWVFFDGGNLYISARCWDSHPEREVANEMRRDNSGLAQNENFGIAIDTFYSRRNAFIFHVNRLGGLTDAMITDERDWNKEWNAVWDARTARFDEGWTVEIVIPFKTLRYGSSGPQVWGLGVRRIVRWKNELSYLTPVPASYGALGLAKLSSAATLVGLETPAGSRSLELKPYAISTVTTDRTATPAYSNDLGGDVGFDAKFGLTRGLMADFSYNTDFAQVEDDERQVNLTRVSLYYPEKREFFLEGQGIFSFGGTTERANNSGSRPAGGAGAPPGVVSNTPVLFFSRQIGMYEGLAVPVRAGGRVTGRAGDYSVGLLNVQTGESDAAGAPATNLSVVRLKRDILRQSTIGLIATSRSVALNGEGSNQAIGADASFTFLDNLFIDAYYARTRTPTLTGKDASYRAALEYVADGYGFKLEHLTVEDDFNPEMGFLGREDFRRNYALVRFSPRPRRIPWIRKIGWLGSLDYITNNRGQLESRLAQAATRIEFQNGDEWRTDFEREFEWLAEPFAVGEDVAIPVGAYAFNNLRSAYTLGPQRRVSGSVTIERGGFYRGDRTTASYRGRVEVSPRLAVEPSLSMNWVDVPQGSFTVKVISGRVTLMLSPRMSAGALVQYASSTDTLSANLRFVWEYQPGSNLYIVYNEGRDTLSPRSPLLQNRTFAIKLTRLFRF